MCFGEYGVAMGRKLAMAEYHLGELRKVPTKADERGLPPIPLQAHFEAAGRAIASMPDQLATGIVVELRPAMPCLPKPTAAYLDKLLNALPDCELRGVLDALVSDPRYRDLRAWRNRATHRFDEKAAKNGVWLVELPDDNTMPRHVISFVEAACAYGKMILDVAPEAADRTQQLSKRLIR